MGTFASGSYLAAYFPSVGHEVMHSKASKGALTTSIFLQLWIECRNKDKAYDAATIRKVMP